MSDYERIYAESLNAPEQFWARAAEAVHWHRKWDRVLDDSLRDFDFLWQMGLAEVAHDHHEPHSVLIEHLVKGCFGKVVAFGFEPLADLFQYEDEVVDDDLLFVLPLRQQVREDTLNEFITDPRIRHDIEQVTGSVCVVQRHSGAPL